MRLGNVSADAVVIVGGDCGAVPITRRSRAVPAAVVVMDAAEDDCCRREEGFIFF